MKTLVVYYSRTGNTQKVAQEVANTLDSEIEEVIDTQKRSGPLGYLRSGRQATKRELTVLKDIKNDPTHFDLIIIGTPVWAGTVSTPIRTYITQNRDKFGDMAFFGTSNASGLDKAFTEMSELSGKTPIATLDVKSEEVKKHTYGLKIQKFINAFKR